MGGFLLLIFMLVTFYLLLEGKLTLSRINLYAILKQKERIIGSVFKAQTHVLTENVTFLDYYFGISNHKQKDKRQNLIKNLKYPFLLILFA